MLNQRKKGWSQEKRGGPPPKKKELSKGLFLYSEGLVRKSQLFVKRNEVGLPRGTRGRGCGGDHVSGGEGVDSRWVGLAG